ncbi:MAG TPA: site-specific integrase [Terriglobia bacterium]|nr:site-specific integrase [Terriglobia bacterium]
MTQYNDYSKGPIWDEDMERYLVEIRFPDGNRLRKRFRKERLAQRWFSIQVTRIEDGTWNQAAPKNIELGKAFDEYREYSKVHHRSHEKFIEPVLKMWEREFGRGSLLGKVTRGRIENVKQRRITEVAPATVDKSLAVLKAFFNWCEVQGTFNFNPVRKIKFFNPNNELVRYLTKEQYERVLIEAVKIRWYLQPLVVLAVHTGLRRGNLLNLRWDQTDLDTRHVRITDSTKNRKTLAIPLNDTAYSVLSDLHAGRNGSAYVFPHMQGEHEGEAIQDVKNSWKTALKNAGITNFRWHDLRHCFASWLVMSGVSLAVVQQLLGHRSIKMTLRYAHLSPGYMAEEVKALDKALPIFCPSGAPTRGKTKPKQARKTTNAKHPKA